MKENCQKFSYTLSNGKKAISYYYEEPVIFWGKPLNSGEEIKMKTVGISGSANHQPTIGIRGMENAQLCFDKNMEKLIRPVYREIGVHKDIEIIVEDYSGSEENE